MSKGISSTPQRRIERTERSRDKWDSGNVSGAPSQTYRECLASGKLKSSVRNRNNRLRTSQGPKCSSLRKTYLNPGLSSIGIQMHRNCISEIFSVLIFLYRDTIFQSVCVFQYWCTFPAYSLYRDTISGQCISLQC